MTAPDPRAPWEPPDLAPLNVGDRVTIRHSGECPPEPNYEPRDAGRHWRIEDGRAAWVRHVFSGAGGGGHRYRVSLQHAPPVCRANDCTPRRRLRHDRFYARAELSRRPDAP